MKPKILSEAFLFHLQWKIQLRDFIDGKGDFDVAEISPKGCSFGKWLCSAEIRQNASTLEIQELVSTHDDLHETAKRAYDLKILGQDNAARQELGKIVKSSIKLCSLLNAMNIITDNQSLTFTGIP
jgi:hypothetical protein